MSIAEVEKELVELDRKLHHILAMVRRSEDTEEIVDSTRGTWGYEVDSVQFARHLRQTRRVG